jgi:hypothetical protein
MNEYLIEIMLALFWTGFIGLNLWLWRASEAENLTDVGHGIRKAEGESPCSTQSAR